MELYLVVEIYAGVLSSVDIFKTLEDAEKFAINEIKILEEISENEIEEFKENGFWENNTCQFQYIISRNYIHI